jgi:hypothetical protein
MAKCYSVELEVTVSDVKAESHEAAEQAVEENLIFMLKGVEFCDITIDRITATHESEWTGPDDEDEDAAEETAAATA